MNSIKMFGIVTASQNSVTEANSEEEERPVEGLAEHYRRSHLTVAELSKLLWKTCVFCCRNDLTVLQ